jgi:hypothetical protein
MLVIKLLLKQARPCFLETILKALLVKVAFVQKVVMHSSYPQTHEPNYSPQLLNFESSLQK